MDSFFFGEGGSKGGGGIDMTITCVGGLDVREEGVEVDAVFSGNGWGN